MIKLARKHICASIILALDSSRPPARMKGNKAYTTSGNWIEIFDFVKQTVTLIDPARKTFATLPASQLADKMAGAFPQAATEQMQAAQQTMASIKTNVDSKMTGKAAEIQGVQAEEREVTVTMDIPMPAKMNQNGPSLRLVMHIWTAKKEEALRVPAIWELTGYQAWQKYIVNPAGMFENPSVILRTHMEMYMPFMAVMARQMAGQGQAPAIDPDAPLMEMDQEVAELSSTPVDASLFEIPADYTAVPAEGMIREMVKAQSAAAAAAPK